MTPLVDASTIIPGLKLKIEYHNPSLSIKHRGLPPHIFAMARNGKISTASRLAIISAGSAGIAVAWAANQIGCKASIFVPPGTPEIIVSYIDWLGGEVLQIPAGQSQTIQQQIRCEPSWTVIEQLSDHSLCKHYEVVGEELLIQSSSFVIVIVGTGTAASVMGISAALHKHKVKIFAVEPAEAAVLQGQPWHPHRISGLAPPIMTELFDHTVVDGLISVPSDAAWQTARDVMNLTGESIGPSSGACVYAAKQLREQGFKGELIAICSSSIITALVNSKETVTREA